MFPVSPSVSVPTLYLVDSDKRFLPVSLILSCVPGARFPQRSHGDLRRMSDCVASLHGSLPWFSCCCHAVLLPWWLSEFSICSFIIATPCIATFPLALQFSGHGTSDFGSLHALILSPRTPSLTP